MRNDWKKTGVLLLMTTMIACQAPEKKDSLDPNDMDTSIVPGDDFDNYANGGWKKNNPMPEEKARYGSFDKLRDAAELQVQEIFKELNENEFAEGSVEKKISDFYKSGMDTTAIEEAGMKPIEPYLEQINKLSSKRDMMHMLAQWSTIYSNPLFGFGTSSDMKNSNLNVLYFWQGGISMPDRDYYLKTDAKSVEIQEKYRNYVAQLFELTGLSKEKATKNAETIYGIEKQIAEMQMSLIDRRDPFKIYNKMSIGELREIAPDMQWEYFFKVTGTAAAGEIVVTQPKFFENLNKLINTVTIEDWKTYLSYNQIADLASFGLTKYSDLSFDFYGRTLKGQEAQRPRWKRVQETTNKVLGEAIGKMYVDKHFPAEAKQRMIVLVENLRKSLANRIDALDWMSQETKAKAHEKLANINVKLGYPDEWKDYSKLEVTGSYAENLVNASKFAYAEMLEKINKPVDKLKWSMTPQTVNAYYSPTKNEIAFPAAILQPPFFYMDGDDAINYGAIGVVIGHEITHGFDDRGRSFDAQGNLNDWWQEEDAKKFDEKSKILIDQFDNFIVSIDENGDTIKANGTFTLGENIADLGGLYISYDAMKMARKGNEPTIDNFTPDQRFFLAYARLWAGNVRDAEKIRLTNVDEHSLGRFRVIGALQNMPAFYEAFNVKEEHKMWLPEEKRALIW